MINYKDLPPLELIEDIKQYPKVRSAVTDNWHTKWLNEYLNKLITDTDNHTRVGFPQKAFSAIIQLQMHNREYLINNGMHDEDIESKFGFDTGVWDMPRNFFKK